MSFTLKTILQILRDEFPPNNSGVEVILSLGEALIIIIDACKKTNTDKSIIKELNQLYLEGIRSKDDRDFVEELKEFMASTNYTIKTDPKTINQDPTRRYFETQLSFSLLKINANSLDTKELTEFKDNLKKRLQSLPKVKITEQAKIELILAGIMDDKVLNKYELEYAELTYQLLSLDYHGLSREACDNLYQIACSTILATLNTIHDKSMPVNVYSDSIFTMGMDGRGRRVKIGNDEVRTTAKGLMTSTTPLPLYSDKVNPVADHYGVKVTEEENGALAVRNEYGNQPTRDEYDVQHGRREFGVPPIRDQYGVRSGRGGYDVQSSGDESGVLYGGDGHSVQPSRDEYGVQPSRSRYGVQPFYPEVYVEPSSKLQITSSASSPFQRSADQASFMLESDWSQHLFSRQTQLYSNGISSTTLAQLRNMVLQKRMGHPYHKGSFQEYMTAFAAMMVYNSGGHSFFEIFEVFKLPQFQELMHDELDLEEALAADCLMYKMLCEDQPEAFEQAFELTQVYTHTLLKKKIMHAELSNHPQVDLDLQQPTTLHEGVTSLDIDAFKRLVEQLKSDGALDTVNADGWTGLMVAAQLGKTEYVKILIDAGADVEKAREEVGFSALELAIKSSKYETVLLLLNEGAAIIEDEGEPFKYRYLALYLACRQNNMPILKEVLKRGAFNAYDIKEALLSAVAFESIAAINTIMEHVKEHHIEHYFEEGYKTDLLIKAVNLGNIELIHGIEALDINTAANQIDYDLLVKKASAKEFSPLVIELRAKAGKKESPDLKTARSQGFFSSFEGQIFDDFYADKTATRCETTCGYNGL